MKKIMLCGVGGNIGQRAAKILLEKYPHEDLIFSSPTMKNLEQYKEMGVETRVAEFSGGNLKEVFEGVDTVVLISMPFNGERRVNAQKNVCDGAVAAGVNRIVYTSCVGAGDPDADTYEINDHKWFESYVKSQPIHYVFMRNSQYGEAMVSSYIQAHEQEQDVMEKNMGDGKMAFVARNDCAKALAYAAMSDAKDRVFDINGAELMDVATFIEIGNSVTGWNVVYREISDEDSYAYFDSIGVPRTTEEAWGEKASAFPYCSEGMVSFGRALRLGQMAVFTDDFEKLTGDKPISVREMFENMEDFLVGNRHSVD